MQTEKLAGLNNGDLKDIRVGLREVTFKVGPNKKNYTAADVVNEIRMLKFNYKNSLRIQKI